MSRKEGKKPVKRDILLSISIMVSGREETTEKCIASLDQLRKKVSCELILTDTGCPAKMRDWLQRRADRVIRFQWCNDFAAARNVGLQAASGKWFLFMDDDEWFEDTSEIEQFFLTGEYQQYESASYIVRNYANMEGTIWRDTALRRMTRVRSNTQFFYPIHEILWPVINPSKQLADYAHHYGYASADPEVQMAKRQRNLSILLPEIRKDSRCMHHYVQAVAEYVAMEDYQSAFELAEQGIANCDEERGDNGNFIHALYAAAVRMLVRMGKYEEAVGKGLFYLEQGKLNDLARAAISGELVVACGELGNHETCFGHLTEYLKWRAWFQEKKEAWEEQETMILDSTFEPYLYKSTMSWGMAAAIYEGREDHLGMLLEKEPMDWWRDTIALWCSRVDYGRIESLHQLLATGLKEREFYKLMLLIEFSKGYMLKETGEGEAADFGKYNKMVGNFAGEVLLLYENLYQPFILEQYKELVSGEYQMACHLQKAVELEEKGETIEALKEARHAAQFFESAAPIVSSYAKAIQAEMEAREEEQRKNRAEMERLGEQVKRKAEELLGQGQLDAAMAIVMQLRNLIPDDEEVEELERWMQYRCIRNKLESKAFHRMSI